MRRPGKPLTRCGLAMMIILLSTGCAHRGKPIIDTQGVNMVAYQQDLFECQQYAEQVESRAGQGAVGGAIVGGAIGGIVGNSDTAQKGAGVGAVTGLFKGAARTKAERQRVVKSCLRQRGYRVLN